MCKYTFLPRLFLCKIKNNKVILKKISPLTYSLEEWPEKQMLDPRYFHYNKSIMKGDKIFIIGWTLRRKDSYSEATDL